MEEIKKVETEKVVEPNQIQTPEEAYAQLQLLAPIARDTLKEYLKLDKQVKEYKARIKELMQIAATDEFNEGGVKIWLTHIDKSYLHKESVIRFLKDNNLTDLIVTTEDFDDASIIMAAQHGRINAADLAPFKVEKEEIRLNIK